MNKRQIEVQKTNLAEEKRVLEELKNCYQKASEDCAAKIRELAARTDMQNLQSIVYQKQYQQALKKQIDSILDLLQTESFSMIAEYLSVSYENGFVGTLYDLQGQGVPLLIPIDQSQVVKALQNDTKLSQGYYARLGEDVNKLKKSVKAQVSRGIANGSTWLQVATELTNQMVSPFKTSMYNAMRMARTEGHRIQQQAQWDTLNRAKKCGADVVKQWDSTLDDKTRESHRILHGQIKELDEDFEVNSHRAKFPGGFGVASEDIHCRCVLTQKARWALDTEETHYLGDAKTMTDAQLKPIADKLGIPVDELRKYSGQIIPVTAKDYTDFRRQYNRIWHYKAVPETIEKTDDFGIIKNVNTANGIKVSAPSQHMLERAAERGVTAADVTNALQQPLHINEVKTDNQGRRSQRFIGALATVNVNPDSGIVTTIWKTGQKTKEKYQKE